MSENLRIHIAPVGFEVTRVTKPLIEMHADEVRLVRHENDSVAASRFIDGIKKELREGYRHIRVTEVRVDIWNIYSCLGEFRRIIQEGDNHVYINVSTGTKITAMAGMLACMIWGAEPYYARISYPAREVRMHTEHVMESDTFPVYGIKRPRTEYMRILGRLESHGGKARKSALIEGLVEDGMIRTRGMDGADLGSSAKHSQLRALLDPMEAEWGLVSVEARGSRSEVSVTEQGKEALKIFGIG